MASGPAPGPPVALGEAPEDAWSPRLRRAALGLIAAGAVLRIAQYVFDRSLWLDEAALAMNVVERSYGQLLQPLSEGQGAPLGFLLVEKAVTELLGTSEYALRLFPLVAGLVSLWLFYRVARLALTPRACLLGLALFATADPLIYFSSEVKQYSCDVMVALSLTWMALHLERRSLETAALALSAGLGAAAIWLSHPSVFVLAGVGATLFVRALRDRQWRAALTFAGLGTVWLGSFGASYAVTLSSLIASPTLQTFWAQKFLLEGSTNPAIRFLVDSKLVLLVPLLLGFLLLRSRDHVRSMLVLPACFAFAAAALRMYPFSGRLILFLLPLGLLLLARELSRVIERPTVLVRRIGTAVAALMLAPLVALSGYRLLVPRVREETRAEIEWMSRRARPGDVCYAYYATHTSFRYYAPRFGLDPACIRGVMSRDDRSRYVADLHGIPRRERVWVLFSHVHRGPDALDERQFFLAELDRMGRRVTGHEGINAYAYLYDLTPARASTAQSAP